MLAIETSCDETAVAIIEYDKRKQSVCVLANLVSSQVKLHAKFGGVVPNLARREHEANLAFVLKTALWEAKLTISNSQFPITKQVSKSKKKQIDQILAREQELLRHFKKQILPLGIPDIDAIAVTYGPGLAPALWVGVNFARALSYIWGLPLIPVNHMEGHIFSALINQSQKDNAKLKMLNSEYSEFGINNLELPAIALLVSGGHTELVLTKKLGKYKIVGETLDDAVGEAFDKVARLLDLPYPGGPEISRLAERALILTSSQDVNIRLPRPMLHSKDFDFSFSGLKTAVLYLVQDLKKKFPMKEIQPSVAKEFQDAVTEVLVSKTMRAVERYNIKTVILGGGVAANSLLRKELSVKCQVSDVRCLLPSPVITGDNALMIALAAAITGKIMKKPQSLKAVSNLRLS